MTLDELEARLGKAGCDEVQQAVDAAFHARFGEGCEGWLSLRDKPEIERLFLRTVAGALLERGIVLPSITMRLLVLNFTDEVACAEMRRLREKREGLSDGDRSR